MRLLKIAFEDAFDFNKTPLKLENLFSSGRKFWSFENDLIYTQDFLAEEGKSYVYDSEYLGEIKGFKDNINRTLPALSRKMYLYKFTHPYSNHNPGIYYTLEARDKSEDGSETWCLFFTFDRDFDFEDAVSFLKYVSQQNHWDSSMWSKTL